MTLDEAIKHCEEVAKHEEWMYISELQTTVKCTGEHGKCAADHRQLAECQNSIEHTAYIHGKGGGYMQFGKQNIDFLTGWLGNPEREDYEP